MLQRSSSISRTVANSVSPDQSDQKVSRRRSSHGKPNRIASIPVVSSIETVSTQSNTFAARQAVKDFAGGRERISASMSAMAVGVNLGATVRRWPVCCGRIPSAIKHRQFRGFIDVGGLPPPPRQGVSRNGDSAMFHSFEEKVSGQCLDMLEIALVV